MNLSGTEFNSRELMKACMLRKRTPRIPTMPQICHDIAVRIFAPEDGEDWIDGMARCVENPAAIYEYVIRLVERVNCDGLRLFVKPDPMEVKRVGDSLVAIDRETKGRTGRIDIEGGGGLIPDNPPLPVQSLEEAGKRLKDMVQSYTDEKMEILRTARESVPEKFVASSPIGITMNTYSILRGREQAMIDLYERPDFVSAVIEMQADAAIEQAEKLLKTGIDAFYIGDPAASSSLISPQHFERFCLPAYQKFCRYFLDAGILIYIHICGNVNPILEMMAACGAHAVEPLDPLGGVSVADAKQRIGESVALMGGVNTLTLADGSEEDVRAEAVRKCREGGPFGYILAAGDMVPPGTPFQNLQAMVEVSRKSLWKESIQ